MVLASVSNSILVRRTEALPQVEFGQAAIVSSESFEVKTANTIIKEIATPKPKPVTITVISKPAATGSARVVALENYLHKKNSYLADYAQLIVDLSDQYGVDYRLLVAISGVESSYCQVNFRPYNCWGYGRFSWSSPEDGIRGYMAEMNKGYFSQGRRTVETIAQKYNPWPDNWTKKVYLHWNQI